MKDKQIRKSRGVSRTVSVTTGTSRADGVATAYSISRTIGSSETTQRDEEGGPADVSSPVKKR
jgi:hypothetical protein